MSEQIKLYTDENIQSAIIAGLRQRGVDVLTTPEAGMLSATDPDHLALAHSLGRAVLTRDDDFLRLNAAGVPHSGIIFFRQHRPIGEVIRNFMLVYRRISAEEIQNLVEYL